ncbi:MAG: SDR family NAD(P)-dependent oxidoreductase [Mycobacteriales bacterium]
MRVTGKVALVTGASSGIGRATAVELARQGAVVAVTARREGLLAETVSACARHTSGALSLVADLGSPGEPERVVAAVQSQLGRLDILVNNAGIPLHLPAADTPVTEIDRVVTVNFLAPVHATMAALPGMLERHCGAVVNVTSVAGYLPNPGEGAYGASKAALSLWTHALAVDLHGTGVEVSVVSPGPIDTEIWSKDQTPSPYTGRKYPPELVARAILRSIERRTLHRTTPRHYGALAPAYLLVGRPMRWGLRRFGQHTPGTAG